MVEKRKKPIRVLIVDDSFFTRKVLREILLEDSEIEVVGEAKDGAEAVKQAILLKPDVITMDYNMPKLNGAEATEKILDALGPFPVILMVSAYTKEGAEETFISLRAGAVDFIQKPSGEISFDLNKVQDELLSKIKMSVGVSVKRYTALKKTHESRKTSEGVASPQVIVIGASTGGPPLVEDIIASLPADFPVGIVVAQHMPPNFTGSFADRIDKLTSLSVKEGESGDKIEAGHAIVAPGGMHTLFHVSKTENSYHTIRLQKHKGKKELEPSIDRAMLSASEVFGKHAIGIVLTGMGNDGMEGMRAIKEAGGHTIVQDPDTAVVGSMPQAVIDEGLADQILAPNKIAARLIKLVGHS
jgi:two-component system, chemotaxis family, protein-glutamate methylesterase/glutaminase